MSGLNIGNLPSPPQKYDPARRRNRVFTGFETTAKAREEDQLRLTMLRKQQQIAWDAYDLNYATDLRTLADKFEQALRENKTPQTCASSLYMREHRRNISGWLAHQASRSKAEVAMLNVVPASWKVNASDLHLIDPTRMLEQVRSALNRCGANKASGALIIGFDGEYEPTENIYQLHFTCLAFGEMIEVVDRLRTKPKYRSCRKVRDDDDLFADTVRQRVHRTRKPISNLIKASTYVIKSFWPSRAIFIDENGKRQRTRIKRRLPEPHHSQYLLWMDRWSIGDFTLMMGLRATNSGLKSIKKPNTNGGLND
tara:strand:+ start:31870 stop:32802 length:933 start_codon:yes stop_codon:yes gene_type:complete